MDCICVEYVKDAVKKPAFFNLCTGETFGIYEANVIIKMLMGETLKKW